MYILVNLVTKVISIKYLNTNAAFNSKLFVNLYILVFHPSTESRRIECKIVDYEGKKKERERERERERLRAPPRNTFHGGMYQEASDNCFEH